MKRLLNNLYVFSRDIYIHKDHETIVIDKNVDGKNERILQIPVHAISGIYIYNNSLVSSYLVEFCSEHNINLAYFTENGRLLGRFENGANGNVLLRRKQFTISDNSRMNLASNQVIAKLRSSINILQRFLRNNETADTSKFSNAIFKIKDQIKKIKRNDYSSFDELRGAEGIAATSYFSCFNDMLLYKDFAFECRTKRPPRDPVNAMLSYLYTILASDITQAINSVGLDAQVGFLHTDKSGRCSLSLDIIEEFRSFIVDRLVLSMINRKEIKLSSFKNDICNGCVMDDEVKKHIVSSYQDKKKEIIVHPLLKEKVPIGILFHIQIMLYAQYLRNDLENYPPFYFR